MELTVGHRESFRVIGEVRIVGHKSLAIQSRFKGNRLRSVRNSPTLSRNASHCCNLFATLVIEVILYRTGRDDVVVADTTGSSHILEPFRNLKRSRNEAVVIVTNLGCGFYINTLHILAGEDAITPVVVQIHVMDVGIVHALGTDKALPFKERIACFGISKVVATLQLTIADFRSFTLQIDQRSAALIVNGVEA